MFTSLVHLKRTFVHGRTSLTCTVCNFQLIDVKRHSSTCSIKVILETLKKKKKKRNPQSRRASFSNLPSSFPALQIFSENLLKCLFIYFLNLEVCYCSTKFLFSEKLFLCLLKDLYMAIRI